MDMYPNNMNPTGAHAPSLTAMRDQLPKVGDRLKKMPFLGADHTGMVNRDGRDCVVTYVNAEHLWYEVEFQGALGPYRECYKLPENDTNDNARS